MLGSRPLGSTPQTRTLNRALERCGGEIALAKALGVTIEVLSGWITGDDVPPKMYLSALDIVAMGALRLH
jgi:DNA-binding transcriptional regulator YdaS (Cro superfamily)